METTEHPVVPHCFYDGKTMKIPDKFRVSEFHDGKTMDTSCFDGFYPHVCGCRSKTLGT